MGAKSPPHRPFFGPRALLFGLTAAVCCAGAYLLAQILGHWLGSEPAGPASPPAPAEYEYDGLVVAAADLDLGEVWDAAEIVRDIPIRNRSGSEKKAPQLGSSCHCTTVECAETTIPPGGAATFRVRIDPTRVNPDEAHLTPRPFAVRITPVADSCPPSRSGWVVRATLKSRVTLGALNVHFGERIVQGQTPSTRTVAAVAHVPHQRLEVKVEPPETATATLTPDPEHPDRAALRITPASDLRTGPFRAAVLVNVVDPSGEVLPGARLPIAGDVQPEARLLPARVLLGAHPVGTTAEAVVVLQAPPDAAWAVDHIETDSPDVVVEPAAAEGVPAGRTFRVKQRAAKEGDQTDAVRFTLRKAGGPPRVLAMEVSIHGESAQALVPPAGEGGRQP